MKFLIPSLASAAVIVAAVAHAGPLAAVSVHNSDMEQVTRDNKTKAIIPVGWKAGGDLGFDFSAIGPDAADAASGSYFARLSVKDAANRAFWIVSDFIPARGVKKVKVNFSVRSTFTDVRVSIHQFDSNWKELNIVDGPVINFTELNWVRYADKAGTVQLSLNPRASAIELVFSGLAQAGNNQLDVDAVSIELSK